MEKFKYRVTFKFSDYDTIVYNGVTTEDVVELLQDLKLKVSKSELPGYLIDEVIYKPF